VFLSPKHLLVFAEPVVFTLAVILGSLQAPYTKAVIVWQRMMSRSRANHNGF